MIDDDEVFELTAPHGSRFARGWLAAFAAAGRDDERRALYRAVLVERFGTGVRFSCTDGFWSACAWVGDPVDPTAESPVFHDPPGVGEVPADTLTVIDVELRIRDLMQFVARCTKKIDADHPEVTLTLRVRSDHDPDVPRLDSSLDQDLVEVAIPSIEHVTGHVSEVGFPNLSRLHWQHDEATAADLDQVMLSPRLLRDLARAVDAVDSDGVLLTFHGDPTAPISWRARQPAAAILSGLLMPQRPTTDQDED